MKLILLSFLIFLNLSCSSHRITSKNVVSSGIVKLFSVVGGHGTGFYISKNEIITAKHVCEIPFLMPHDHSVIVERVLDDYSDLCYIRVEKSPLGHQEFQISYQELAIGDETCNAGFGAFGYVYNCGNIKGMVRYFEYGMLNWLYFSSQFSIPGMSGGPVFKGRRVVGVTVIQYQGELGFVSNQQLKRFLEYIKGRGVSN